MAGLNKFAKDTSRFSQNVDYQVSGFEMIPVKDNTYSCTEKEITV